MNLFSGLSSTSSRVRTRLSGQDGIALLMVLVVITILTTLVVSFTDTTQKHLRVTQYYKNRLQAYWAAQSGLQAAAGLLKMDPYAGKAAGATSTWNCESVLYQEFVTPILANVFCESSMIEGALLLANTNSAETETTLSRCPAAVPIVDENRKLSLAGLVKDTGTNKEETDAATFERLLYLLQSLIKEEDLAPAEEQQDSGFFGSGQEAKISDGKAEELAGYLVDWMDTENNKSPDKNPDTAEEGCLVDGLPYEAKNGLLDSIEEIGLVCGFRQMTRPTIERLTRHLTAYELKTNINTATYAVLYAFMQNEEDADEIYRGLHGTAEQEAVTILENETACRNLLDGVGADKTLCNTDFGLKSDHFRIGIYGVVFDTETGTVTARARLQMDLRQKQDKQLELLYYRED